MFVDRVFLASSVERRTRTGGEGVNSPRNGGISPGAFLNGLRCFIDFVFPSMTRCCGTEDLALGARETVGYRWILFQKTSYPCAHEWQFRKVLVGEFDEGGRIGCTERMP